MERLKNMGLRRSLFLLSVFCLAAALLLTFGVYQICVKISERFPRYGVVITSDGVMTEMEPPTPEQERILKLLNRIQLAAIVMIPMSGLGVAGALFYQLKVTYSHHLRGGGFLLNSAKALSINKLTPCVPRFSRMSFHSYLGYFTHRRSLVFAYLISLCNLIYPVINVLVITLSITLF